MRTGLPLVIVTTGALAAAGCVPLPGSRALAPKEVAAKEGEATLVADDGSRCTVPPREFERAEVGEDAWCVWKDAEGTGGARGPARVGPGQRTGRP
jgi:hypothetical protein